MTNYPPGVTGNEYQIAGADYERDVCHNCATCHATQDGTEQGYGDERWFICSVCDEITDLPWSGDE